MKRLLTLLLVLGLAFTVSVAWAQSTLVYGTTDKVTDMDPASAYDIHPWEIFQNVSAGLMTYVPGTAKIVNGLAASYTVNKAGDEYTFKRSRFGI